MNRKKNEKALQKKKEQFFDKLPRPFQGREVQDMDTHLPTEVNLDHPDALGFVRIVKDVEPSSSFQRPYLAWRAVGYTIKSKKKPDLDARVRVMPGEKDDQAWETIKQTVESWFDQLSNQSAHGTPLGGHGILPGTIIYSQWGYDQTNVNFYMVVKSTEHFINVVKLESMPAWDHPQYEIFYSEEQREKYDEGMRCPLVPIIPTEIPNLKGSRVKAERYGNRDHYIKLGYGTGRVWDGTPRQSTYYA